MFPLYYTPLTNKYREALAAENSSIYYPLLSEISSQNLNDKELHDFAINFALDKNYITKEQIPFVDLSLGIHRQSALVHAYHQFYETATLSDRPESDCATWLQYSGKSTCDLGLVFALETKPRNEADQVLPIDRVLGDNENAPLAVLYSDIVDSSFSKFHTHLESSAKAGKIRYVVRYRPSKSVKGRQQLTGYGAELYVKRTDYLVIDDRDTSESDAHGGDAKQVVLKPESEGGTISKGNMKVLGYKAANFILSHENKFEALVNATLDFPKYSFALSKGPIDRKLNNELMNSGIKPGTNAIYVNGAPVDSLQDDIFSIAKIIDRERKFMQKFKSIGIEPSEALDLITSNDMDSFDSSQSSTRFDYRTESLVWLNNLANDRKYNKWSKDVNGYLKMAPGQIMAQVAHNAHTLVYVMDFSQPRHYSRLAELMNLLYRTSPIQVGIVPLISTAESEEFAREVLTISSQLGGDGALAYISSILEGNDHVAAFRGVGGSRDDLNSDITNSLIEDAKVFANRLDLVKDSPTLFGNGLMVPVSPKMFYEITDLVRADNVLIQNLIRDGKIDDNIEIKDVILEGAEKERNSLINPIDPKAVEYIDSSEIFNLKSFDFFSDSNLDETLFSLSVIGDASDDQFVEQVKQALQFVKGAEEKVKLRVIPTISGKTKTHKAKKVIGSLNGSIDSTLKLLDSLDEESEISVVSGNKAPAGLAEGVSVLTGSGRILTLPESKVLTSSHLGLLRDSEILKRIKPILDYATENEIDLPTVSENQDAFDVQEQFISLTNYVKTNYEEKNTFFMSQSRGRVDVNSFDLEKSIIELNHDVENDDEEALVHLTFVLNPVSEKGQVYTAFAKALRPMKQIKIDIILSPSMMQDSLELKRFYRANIPHVPLFDKESGYRSSDVLKFEEVPQSTLFNLDINVPSAWITVPEYSVHDLENIVLDKISEPHLEVEYLLKHLLLEGHSIDTTRNEAPRGMALELGTVSTPAVVDTSVMANLGYMQLKANPGLWILNIKEGSSSEIFELKSTGIEPILNHNNYIFITDLTGLTLYPKFTRKYGMEAADVLEGNVSSGLLKNVMNMFGFGSKKVAQPKKNADINIFTVASGHLYERFMSIMTISVMRHTDHTVKFWLIENFLSPSFKEFLPHLAAKYGFEYELVSYKWPHWLRGQAEKQRTIWGFKILFLDVLFPQSLDKVIFVDADQIVRTDMMDLNEIDLEGAPYGFTPMCDSREEIEGFRFWKQGYWKNYLGPLKYHISALYVVDLKQFRRLAAGDQLRQHYQMLSADPGSLSNLDQDLPNHLQKQLPIFSLPQDWLWCETWCSDESLLTARTIDLCNNPMTKEPKLDRARRQVPEWTEYDDLVSELRRNVESDKGLQEETDNETLYEEKIDNGSELISDEETDSETLYEEKIDDVPELIPDEGSESEEEDPYDEL